MAPPPFGAKCRVSVFARLGRSTDLGAVTENLLRISGENMVSADRKFKSVWHGRLSVRFLILTNQVPSFADASGALANRFVPLTMSESFLGRENHGLIGELLPNLPPGVLNWAIEG